jgi:hypothetical protein
MTDLNAIVLAVVFTAIFFYVLYGVIRAAVRDGITQAYEQRQHAQDLQVCEPAGQSAETQQ